jgi:hypothetical protein
MSKFMKKILKAAKPRMSRVAKPRALPRLGAAPSAPRSPVMPPPAGLPRGIPRRRWR